MKNRIDWKKVCKTNSNKILYLLEGLDALISDMSETDKSTLARKCTIQILANDFLRIAKNLEGGIYIK